MRQDNDNKAMKISRNFRLGFRVALAALLAGALQVFAGHPPWPPRQHSAEYRQANMLFLRFQDALAAERWPEALALCSDRVRAKAAQWPSPKAFFNDTIPTRLLLAQDFGFWTLRCDQPGGFDWTDKATLYALVVNLTEPESQPALQWFWTISATNHAWVVDYPPVKMEDYVARKKAALQEREDKIKQIRLSLQPRLEGLKTHLVPVNQRFIIGSPMLFRVELTNAGKTAADYMDSGVAYAPLTVLDDKGQPLPCVEIPGQIAVRKGEVASGASVVLADQIDLNQHYAFTKPGKYAVQFSGAKLEIGQPLSTPFGGSHELFGENDNEVTAVFDFLAVTNRFPSEPVKIEVTAGRKP
jgi:hypothetical protein